MLLDTFLVDSGRAAASVAPGLEAQADAQALRLAAHSFKGSCSNMGASLLAGLCKQLEDCARREQLEMTWPLLSRLTVSFAIVRILFKSERQRYANPDL